MFEGALGTPSRPREDARSRQLEALQEDRDLLAERHAVLRNAVAKFADVARDIPPFAPDHQVYWHARLAAPQARHGWAAWLA